MADERIVDDIDNKRYYIQLCENAGELKQELVDAVSNQIIDAGFTQLNIDPVTVLGCSPLYCAVMQIGFDAKSLGTLPFNMRKIVDGIEKIMIDWLVAQYQQSDDRGKQFWQQAAREAGQ